MSKKQTKNPIEELKNLILEYFRQETIQPLKRLALWAVLGLLGSIFISIGFIFLLVGSIRVLQNETGSIFQGSLSWVPYLIATGGLIVLSLLSLKLIKGKKNE